MILANLKPHLPFWGHKHYIASIQNLLCFSLSIGVNSNAVRDCVAAMAIKQQNDFKEIINVAFQEEIDEKFEVFHW